MAILRHIITGAPHTYYLRCECTQAAPLLACPHARLALADILERLRIACDLRIYALVVEPQRYHLILRHQEQIVEYDQQIRARWRHITTRSTVACQTLRTRMTSLSDIMQILQQYSSRAINRLTGNRGTIWAQRYRACLLADDAALIAAIIWLHRSPGQQQDSHHAPSTLHISPPPVGQLSAEALSFGDEIPRNLAMTIPDDAVSTMHGLIASWDDDDVTSYGDALSHGWAIGRPESLIEATDRLGRRSGRGRRRRYHDLVDRLGLGVIKG